MAAGHDVALVVSMPDRRRARNAPPTPTPVKERALAHKIAVTERVADVLEADVELGVVVAFGRIIRPEVLARVPLCNLHFSLLPRWRGAAPVERAILAGDSVTGVCLMALEAGLDTGPVYASVETPIGDHETADELRERLGALGTALLLERLASGVGGLGVPVPQRGEPTYAEKLRPEELVLDWARPACELERVVRVGRASTTLRGRRLLVHRARASSTALPGAEAPGTVVGTAVQAGQGSLELLEVQGEGRSRQAAAQWLQGARLAPGERLGS